MSDASDLAKQEELLKAKYGNRLGKKGPKTVAGKAVNNDRKFFDSGDFAMSKAGKTTGPVGHVHPSPEVINHPGMNMSQRHSNLTNDTGESSAGTSKPSGPVPVDP